MLVEVKPYYNIDDFKGHPCMDYPYGFAYPNGVLDETKSIPADASAAFGINPTVTHWEMAHGSGGAEECLENWHPWPNHMMQDWAEAGNIVQYLP